MTTTAKPITLSIEDIIAEMALHGWHHVHSRMVDLSSLPGVTPDLSGGAVLAHMFVATNEIGATMMGVIVVRSNGDVTTHSTVDNFDPMVDHCANNVIRRHQQGAVNTLTAQRTLH